MLQPAARVERPARALLGWMQPNEALLMLTGRRQDVAPTDEQRQLVERLRDGVARRATGIDQSGIEQPATAALTPYIADLEKDQAAAGLIASGCRVVLIDLARVIAAQPLVHVDHADERVAAAQLGDIASIARVSLPTTQPVELPATFDQAQKAWVLTSANPNLRLIGAGQGQAPQGPPVLGFSVALVTSFVRIARYRERYILVDGYHRAHGFLKVVPAFVSEAPSFEGLGLPPVGMLPQDAFLGDRPPLLADYLSDEVSAAVMVPATQKTIAIVGLELQNVG
ncbi:MAG: hypothetical protein E6I60_10425 [Chloroflexi bacterium]|nr:MAG: hypothetical protein E6I60_10425 [Chloroflexota bacterium]